ncbi:hypothetical protein JVU11DRAFT_8116 [Chiua virens]|nr:hypothetical protein JVU11DRAFT_8116 [Chiua virens]
MTTTTDSDPPPHTPIGASTTSDCVEGLQVHGDDGVDVVNIEIDDAHAVAAVAIGMSDITTPVELLDRFSASGSPSMSSTSSDSRPGSSKAVVFPSLNGSCRQGSLSRLSISSSSEGISVSFPSGKDLNLGDQGKPKVNFRMGNSGSSASEDAARRASPPMNPGNGLRKDPQGFEESVIPVSPSSSSSLPLSPTEEKMGARLAAVGWIGEKKAPVLGEGATLAGSSNSQFTSSVKVGSFSFGSNRSNGDNLRHLQARSLRPRPGLHLVARILVYHLFRMEPSEGPANATTLLPAFLATANVKRKKTSRTREIVDQLRSSSVDAGKGGVGLEGLGQQASSSAKGEMESAVGKGSSGSAHAGANGGNHCHRHHPRTDVDVTPGVVSDLAKT